ncbi:MAG TPA: gliding motility-associated ABC transporter substrate-binding protein GldG [Bacteroidales bacterium]|nr:gliding motility-associated ABC transporter substrate-binding protein GldG [Bacteroidales bacterium]
MEAQVNDHKKRSATPVISMLVSIAVILMLTFILSSFFHRFDLTSEKRYTLSGFSKSSLRNLKDIVYIKVYLDGDLNIQFRKMQLRIIETLDEFRVYAGDNLEYELINPFDNKDAAVVEDVVNELYDKGLKPTNILAKDVEGGSTEKLIFPGAIINYRGVEVPVNLLKNNPGAGAEENINNSLQAFEFEFMRVISSLSVDSTEKIAFIEGHGELDEYQVGDLTRELGWYYQVDRGKIDGRPGILDQYITLVIAKPVTAFNERDKFVLDQYIMQGGKILWFLDLVNANLDSISEGGPMVALIHELNVQDLLFRYGVRVNPILIQDVQCNVIPVNVALAGNPADFRPAPWIYSPLLTAPGKHPITRNLNMIRTEFAGSIDTLEARKGIKKTVLLASSEYSRSVTAPVIISLDEVRYTPSQDQFTSKHLPVAVLLEGSFESAFRNRMISQLFPDTAFGLTESGSPAALLVVADGDIIRNDVRPTPQGVLISPLGLDRFTQQTFGNKEFIVNAIHYLTGHGDLINLRSRELTLRLLDKARIKEDRTKWVLTNTIGPPLLIILAGILFAWLRKKKYAGT